MCILGIISIKISLRKEIMKMENAIIHIERRAAWADLLRSYKIVLDEKVAGTIRSKRHCSFEVRPGRHEIFLTISWCSSRHLLLDLAPGEEVNLVCQGRTSTSTLYNVTVGADDYIILFQEPFIDPLKY
jgi:hypothetical protein